MSTERCSDHERRTGFPRVSGDEPETAALICAHAAFSPRERG